MSSPYQIRLLKPGDEKKIKDVALRSWLHTYKEIFNVNEIEEFNNRNYSVKNIGTIANEMTQEKSKPHLNAFYVLEEIENNNIIGFAQVNYEKYWELDLNNLEALNETNISLSRIYLDPDFIGKGLGKLLLTKVEEFVKQAGKNKYGLFVHENNEIGKRFYNKMGFEHITEKDKDDEWYLEKTLKIGK